MPLAADRPELPVVGVGVHLPQESWYCSLTLPAPPIWPPRLTVVRPNAAHGRSRKGSERDSGTSGGRQGRGVPTTPLSPH